MSGALGGLPLALELAASYVEEKRSTVSSYLALLPKHQGKLLAPVADAFRISVKELSAASLLLLRQLSFLAPDDVPRSLLMAGGDGELEFDEALAGLIRYSLVEVSGDGLFTHRLLQSAVRAEVPDSRELLSGLTKLLNDAFGYRIQDLSTWTDAARLYPHVLSLTDHAGCMTQAIESQGLLLNGAALYALHVVSDLATALRLAKGALEIDEKVYGAEHPIVASLASNIGQIFQAQGNLEGALQYTRRALAIDEKVYGAEHPDVAIYASNIGAILNARGDLDEALRYTRRALAIDEKVYGTEHPHLAICANNIGMILKAQGDLEGALQYARRALAIDEKVYGAEHPKVAIRANNIGQILQDQADLDGALRYSRRALAIDEKVYGAEHPNVARDANNIGLILKAQGDLDGALKHTRRALTILQKAFGPDNPSTRTVAGNLARLEQQQKAAGA